MKYGSTMLPSNSWCVSCLCIPLGTGVLYHIELSSIHRYGLSGCGWLQRGKKKQEKEGEPQIVRPSNGATASRLLEMSTTREPRDGATDENLVRQQLFRRGLLLVAFSSFEATRKRGKRWRLLLTHAGRRSLGDFSCMQGEENETSPWREEKKTR
ncbi:hypothetical protein GW17_00011823 [Ensete ventricosum]|nr:hypothetical protein GW17_00011823 [Ensete ventricosum]